MELAHIRCGGACFCISRKSKMKKEQSQNYPFVITYFSNRYRLIECRDRIQWILQRRDKNVPRWRGIYYFLNTQSMSRIFRQFDLDDWVVDQLPECFERRFKAVQREPIKSDDIVLATDKKPLEDKSFFEPQDSRNVRIVRRSAWGHSSPEVDCAPFGDTTKKDSRRRLWVKLKLDLKAPSPFYNWKRWEA